MNHYEEHVKDRSAEKILQTAGGGSGGPTVGAEGEYLRTAAQVHSSQELIDALEKASASNNAFSKWAVALTVALVVVGVVQALAALSVALPHLVVATDNPARQVGQEASVGRHQMVTTPTMTLKLDTATGQTWSLDADSVWRPLASAGNPEDKARMIAEIVAESLITAKKIYNPTSGQFDTVTEAQKKEMVEAAVRKAFDTYAHPKTAERDLRGPQ